MAIQRKPEEVKQGAPEYMNTYGDMVTLLLCFFVLLFAMSNIDAAKFQALAASFANNPVAINISAGNPSIKDLYGSGIMQMPSLAQIRNATSVEVARQADLSKMASEFRTYFAENNVADQVQVEQGDNEIVLTFKEGVLFDTGKAKLKDEAMPVLDIVATELIKYPDYEIQIEGHTDTDPINTPLYPDNWYLSAARAISVEKYMVEDKGFDPASILAAGRGEYAPVAPNDTPANKAKNRRVEIRVKSKNYT